MLIERRNLLKCNSIGIQKKAASNRKKHGVSFDEAESVFGDPLARIFDDDVHSNEEKRNAIFGHSKKNRLLVVRYTEREKERMIESE